MLEITEGTRFAIAKRRPAYAAAMASQRPAEAISPLRSLLGHLVATAVLLAMASRHGLNVWFYVTLGIACAWTVEDVVRRTRPLERFLVIVDRRRPGYIQLRAEHDNPRWFRAEPGALHGLETGSIGVAYVRKGTVIAFAHLDA